MKKTLFTLLCSALFILGCSSDDDSGNGLSEEQTREALIGQWKVRYFTQGDDTTPVPLTVCNQQFSAYRFVDDEVDSFEETVGLYDNVFDVCDSQVELGNYDVYDNGSRVKLTKPTSGGSFERFFRIIEVTQDTLRIRVTGTSASANTLPVDQQQTFVASKVN